ncbi:MAG TPA: GDSL-type esterase/lipase family protein [Candidatus Paceibacterota bacterium]
MNTNPNAKRILVYGDSLTFGFAGIGNPGGEKFSSDKRFTGVMQNELGAGYEIIEEGLRGRTVSEENAFFPHRNGLEQFGPIFGSHLPIDLVVFSLGTNDANSGSNKKPEYIPNDFSKYTEIMEFWCKSFNFPLPKILLIAPPIIEEEFSYKIFKDIFKGAKGKSLTFSESYNNFAEKNNWSFLDSGEFIKPGEVDGIHLDEKNNQILGKEIANKIKNIL